MKVPIIYSGFYDAPLAFVVRHEGACLLFWRVFDDDLDDYPDEYQLLLLPSLTDEQIAGSWQSLPKRALRLLGQVAVKDVIFDPTKRREIDSAIFDTLSATREAVLA